MNSYEGKRINRKRNIGKALFAAFLLLSMITFGPALMPDKAQQLRLAKAGYAEAERRALADVACPYGAEYPYSCTVKCHRGK